MMKTLGFWRDKRVPWEACCHARVEGVAAIG